MSDMFSLKQIEMVGRGAILQNVREWMKDDTFHLAFFSGEYGIGKTYLLRRVLKLAQAEAYQGRSDSLVDLYHFRNHAPEDLAQAIFEAFKGTENEQYFNAYQTTQKRLDRARAAGNSSEIRKYSQKILVDCANGLKELSVGKGLLLLFDTAEQFAYPDGRFAPAWDWMKGWLKDLKRGMVLFAGRPEAKPLFDGIGIPGYNETQIGFFTLDESENYIRKVGEEWSKGGNRATFEMSKEDIAQLYETCEGRPILLAMFLEVRLHNPQAFRNLAEIKKEEFEKLAIEGLMNLPKGLGEVIKSVARARKGMNEELLIQLLGISKREAHDKLLDIRDMSFVKTFPGDERVFLHDDLYDLFYEYVFDDVADAKEKQTASQAIYTYYNKEIDRQSKEIRKIFSDLTKEVDFQKPENYSDEDYVVKISALESVRQRLKADFVHYRLRSHIAKEGGRKAHEDDPVFAGIKMYYRYGHEAATSSNDQILTPLKVELMKFGFTLEVGDFWKPFVEGLILVNDVWLGVATGQEYENDVPELKKRIELIPDLGGAQKSILLQLLDTWLGTRYIFTKPADYKKADETLTAVINTLKGIDAASRLEWFKSAVMSLAYRQRAYGRRVRGMFLEAIKDFLESLYYNRQTHFNHEEATLRNDLGYAQTLLGQFRYAYENLSDGLELRYALAIGHRIALSHSSLAQHLIAKGYYEEAHKHARYAIRIADAVGYQRGRAFGYLADAEALRRFSSSTQGEENRAEKLDEAEDAIKIAITEVGEKARQIDAELEYGCLYRDRMRVEKDASKRKAWFNMSADLLKKTADDAKNENIPYRWVDAHTNLIWLGNYANDVEYVETSIQEFKNLEVLKPYWLKEDGQFEDGEAARKDPILWALIGKYYLARSMIVLAKWKNMEKSEEREKLLKEVADFMTLTLCYNAEFSDDHRGVREARRLILDILKKFNAEELKQFSRSVLVSEKIKGIVKPPNDQSALRQLMRGYALWFGD